MPYWNLYLQDQGFNYQEIGVLSSIAIVTRFCALVWGGLLINLVGGCYCSDSNLDGVMYGWLFYSAKYFSISCFCLSYF